MLRVKLYSMTIEVKISKLFELNILTQKNVRLTTKIITTLFSVSMPEYLLVVQEGKSVDKLPDFEEKVVLPS